MSKPSLFDELIDQYKLEKHIAQNNVTDLYLAYDVDENRQVAVEILLPKLSQSRSFADRFVSKLRKVSQLKHPNIAQVLQVSTTPFNNRPYFAREYMEAYPLRERLNQLAQQSSPVNSVYALKLVQQIAEALALAEKLGIYHYDLQPDKIMQQQDGSIVLVDLGIPEMTKGMANGQLNQDPRYWSPEQRSGKPMEGRSHVYTLGILLYELLTGRLPETDKSFWDNVKVGKSSLEQEREDLSAETYRLVNRALRLQQWSKFQTSEEFAAAIDEAIKAEEFLIRTGAAPTGGSSSRRTFVMALAALAAMLMVAFAIFLIFRGTGDESVNTPVAASIPAAAVTSPEPTETPTPETAVANATFSNLQPAPQQTFTAADTISFSWSWPTTLDDGQQFTVQATSPQGEIELGTTAMPVNGMTYQVTIPGSALTAGPGEYRWQIVLRSADGEIVTQSDPRSFILQAPATATHTTTPTPTTTIEPTPTETLTPTPLPQVRIIFPSVSLREGPGVNYFAFDFLEEGDIVTIIAIDEQDGDWYNVELTDGSGTRGWIAISVTERIDPGTQTIPRAATIPPSPTPTNTPTPTPTSTPTPLPTAAPGGGGGGGGTNPGPPPTLTPPPVNP